jgi:hypothetical protein
LAGLAANLNHVPTRFWEALVNGYPAVVVQQLLERTDVDPNCRDG